VLNAKNHEREAFIVAQAGRKGAVTVSTNMAGRGTDILLGGNPDSMARDVMRKQGKDPDREEFKSRLGAHAEGTSSNARWSTTRSRRWAAAHRRHRAARFAAHRQPASRTRRTPGRSRQFPLLLSLQDDLLRIFGGERMQNLMLRLGMEEDVPIESKLITKRIAAAQKAVEAQNFESRKHLLEYDDVMNKQRQAVYGMRRQLLEGVDQKERVMEMTRGVVGAWWTCAARTNAHPDTWDLPGLQTDMLSQFGVRMNPPIYRMKGDQIDLELYERAKAAVPGEGRSGGRVADARAERNIMLHVIDDQWKDHLLSMDHLKEGIGLRGLRAERPAGRVQKGIVHPVPGHDGPHRRRDPALLPKAGDQRRQGRAQRSLPVRQREKIQEMSWSLGTE
jgi:preprotein translocase subunit SecA